MRIALNACIWYLERNGVAISSNVFKKNIFFISQIWFRWLETKSRGREAKHSFLSSNYKCIPFETILRKYLMAVNIFSDTEPGHRCRISKVMSIEMLVNILMRNLITRLEFLK